MVWISWNLSQSQTIEISKIGPNSVNLGPIEKSKDTMISLRSQTKGWQCPNKDLLNHLLFVIL